MCEHAEVQTNVLQLVQLVRACFARPEKMRFFLYWHSKHGGLIILQASTTNARVRVTSLELHNTMYTIHV